ncbi:agmatinase family protein [Mesobacillus subterraneus]|uniref:Formimidoylglutamase n=1 Tax=Mesobacillus subterraneus TaxID=285983 RepID=A0A3R9KTZ6_9BACI|nr:agmatinase family protein [Mesobacillus subterraneus]RSD26106.1 formimidoylglutamase [Mesobacillus subterraneus]
MGNFSYLEPGKPAIFKDQYVTKVNECIVPFTEGEKGEIGLIGLPFSKTSISFSQAAEAPKAIRACLSGFSTYSGEQEKDYKDVKMIDFGDVLTHPTSTDETIKRLYTSVKEMVDKDVCDRYILLGGDHGVSYPAIRAFQEKYGTVGVIQWDAHHDVRNLEDGGRTNGTPFRSLLEGGFIKRDHLVQLGIRDFANAKKYHEYTKEKGVAVYTMADIESEGIVHIIKREIERLSGLVDFIYLSVDMDAVDQAFAPGCPAIGPGGLTSRELLCSISEAASHEKVLAMDIVEIDPSKDFRDITSRLAASSMLHFMYAAK